MRRKHSQSGITLMEMTVVMAIATVVLMVTYDLLDDALRTTLYLESHNDLAVMSQSAVNNIQKETFQAQQIYGNDARGNAYRTALQLQWTPVAGTALPVIDPNGNFGPDPTTPTIIGGRLTGNALLILRQLPPLPIPDFDHDNDGSLVTVPVTFFADRYRFQYYYIVPDTSQNFAQTGGIYDVVEARSGTYADLFQLNSLGTNLSAADANAQRAWVTTRLIAAGVTKVIDTAAPVATAIYDCSDASTDGTFGNNFPDNPAVIPIVRTKSIIPGLKGGRISGRMKYTVAFHRPGNAPWAETDHPVNRYAQWDNSTPLFPGGFEVKVIGPAGLRQTIVRLAMLSHYNVKRYDSQEAIAITSSRY